MAILLLVLVCVCCLGPGFVLVRWLKWRPAQTLCASIGVSIFLVYLAATCIYLTRLDWHWGWLTTVIFLAMTAIGYKDLWSLLTRRQIRRQLAAFGLLFCGALLLLSIVRHYSGGNWGGDWIEHYFRARYFLDRAPTNVAFIREKYLLPSRPPLMNLFAAYFLGHGLGDGFDVFQVMFCFLNLLVFFPCTLLAGHMVRFGSRRAWLIAAFFGVSPVVIENSTFTWTKLLCAFYVILSLALYMEGWRKQSGGHILGAAVSMAIAMLVHYSAGPFALFMALHYLCILPYRKSLIWEPLAAGSAAIAVLATWFAWAILVFGLKNTFGSNTTVVDSQAFTFQQNEAKIAGNIWDTIIPHPLHMSMLWFDTDFQQPNDFGHVRDYFFMIYEPNLLCSLGLFGWVAALVIGYQALRRSSRWAESLFWCLLIVFTSILGIAVHGTREHTGVAHVSLQPLMLMGITLVAAGFISAPRWVRYTAALFAAIDAVLGIVLQFRLQMHLFRAAVAGDYTVFPLAKGLVSYQGLINAGYRQGHATAFWSDHFVAINWLVLALAVGVLGYWLFTIASASAGADPSVRPARRPWAWAVIALFAAMSVISVLDEALGFREADDATFASLRPAPTTLPRDELESKLRPALLAAQQNPDSATVIYSLAVQQYYLGQISLAASNLIQAYFLDPSNPDVRYMLMVILAVHEIDPAQTEAMDVERLRLNPHSLGNQLAVAVQLFKFGHPAPARQRILQTLQEYPGSPEAYFNLAGIAYRMGLMGEAIQSGEYAMSRLPNNPDVEILLRRILNDAGMQPEAVDRRIREIRGQITRPAPPLFILQPSFGR